MAKISQMNVLKISGRVLVSFIILINFCRLSILSAKVENDTDQKTEFSQKTAVKKYKSLTLRILEKATGITKDITFTESMSTQDAFGLTINCPVGFIEDINNALPVFWAYLEITQHDKNEKIIMYRDWYNNLKPVFENPDFDMEIMEIIS